MRIEKLTWIKLVLLGIVCLTFYRVTTAPRIYCKIPCTTCLGGGMDQDFTELADSIDGTVVIVFSQGKKKLKFNDCYALKKGFFNRTYVKRVDLQWSQLF